MPTRHHTTLLASLLAGSLLLPTLPARAAPTEADRLAARTLLLEGRKKLGAGDPKGALQFFQKAHDIMHVPTTGIGLADAHAQLGQLVEARAVIIEITQMPVKPGEPEAFTDARQQAREALERLDGRIPMLVLQVSGLPLRTVEAAVDGKAIPWSELGARQRVNPGSHEVVVKAPGTPTWKQTVTLNEGERTPLELRIELGASTPSDAPSKAGGPGWRNMTLWAGMGLSAVGVGLGIGFSVAAAGKNADVEAEVERLRQNTMQGQSVCTGPSDPRCSSLVGFVDDRDAYTGVAIAGYVVGGLAAAGTVALWLTKPNEKSSEQGAGAVRIVPSLGGLVVAGTF
ncbi:hypothetical protein [Polyangium jinanense]|uniref:Tetratricopeptide repeat protein n=1 Tax=Polyangium jinanense TaxID=2829994 RepID=A0A9X3X9W6_9BACT|nr:hypothetical protein [Polyangium jinanense]MDC3960488.1 tetratricopeptide repeat protein [Polyangium jinanense]MDC3986739.1 tetratricopeptide repeat protein [Polyangium jinanense]